MFISFLSLKFCFSVDLWFNLMFYIFGKYSNSQKDHRPFMPQAGQERDTEELRPAWLIVTWMLFEKRFPYSDLEDAAKWKAAVCCSRWKPMCVRTHMHIHLRAHTHKTKFPRTVFHFVVYFIPFNFFFMPTKIHSIDFNPLTRTLLLTAEKPPSRLRKDGYKLAKKKIRQMSSVNVIIWNKSS